MFSAGQRPTRRAAAAAHRSVLAVMTNNYELGEASQSSQQRSRGMQFGKQPPKDPADMNAAQKAMWECRVSLLDRHVVATLAWAAGSGCCCSLFYVYLELTQHLWVAVPATLSGSQAQLLTG